MGGLFKGIMLIYIFFYVFVILVIILMNLNFFNQVHKAALHWKGKPFEHYENLCIVFGKDRATGEDAQTPADVVEEMDRQEAGESKYYLDIGDIENLFDGINVEFETTSPTIQSTYVSVSEDENSSRSR